MDLLDDVYSGAAAVGNISAAVGVVFAIFIFTVCLIVAYSLWGKVDPKTGEVNNTPAWATLAMGTLVLVIGLLNWYLTRQFKALAAFEGGDALWRMV